MKKIYTRTGDEGETGLFGGGRVSKDHPRVAAYGAIDELNAILGTVVARLETGRMRERLGQVQGDLFAIGGHLATPRGSRSAAHLPELPVDRPTEFEEWIDEAEDELPELKSFVLPGGSETGAALHHARTVCRRAERAVVRLAEADPVDPSVLVYLNRLSDLLFDFARLQNQRDGRPEDPWKPRD